jgi:hypothetical protein
VGVFEHKLVFLVHISALSRNLISASIATFRKASVVCKQASPICQQGMQLPGLPLLCHVLGHRDNVRLALPDTKLHPYCAAVHCHGAFALPCLTPSAMERSKVAAAIASVFVTISKFAVPPLAQHAATRSEPQSCGQPHARQLGQLLDHEALLSNPTCRQIR